MIKMIRLCAILGAFTSALFANIATNQFFLTKTDTELVLTIKNASLESGFYIDYDASYYAPKNNYARFFIKPSFFIPELDPLLGELSFEINYSKNSSKAFVYHQTSKSVRVLVGAVDNLPQNSAPAFDKMYYTISPLNESNLRDITIYIPFEDSIIVQQKTKSHSWNKKNRDKISLDASVNLETNEILIAIENIPLSRPCTCGIEPIVIGNNTVLRISFSPAFYSAVPCFITAEFNEGVLYLYRYPYFIKRLEDSVHTNGMTPDFNNAHISMSLANQDGMRSAFIRIPLQ